MWKGDCRLEVGTTRKPDKKNTARRSSLSTLQFLDSGPSDSGAGYYANEPQSQTASQHDPSNSNQRSAGKNAVAESGDSRNAGQPSQNSPPADSYIEDDIPF